MYPDSLGGGEREPGYEATLIVCLIFVCLIFALPMLSENIFTTKILLFTVHVFHLVLQTTSECVKFYYVSKKSENFKHLARKANLKRKKPFVKSSDMPGLSSSSNHTLSTQSHSMMLDSKPDSLPDIKPTSGMDEEREGGGEGGRERERERERERGRERESEREREREGRERKRERERERERESVCVCV